MSPNEQKNKKQKKKQCKSGTKMVVFVFLENIDPLYLHK